MNNPFKTNMVKLQAPQDAGPNISVDGFELDLDADRCVEVPEKHAVALEVHGFKRVTSKEVTKRK